MFVQHIKKVFFTFMVAGMLILLFFILSAQRTEAVNVFGGAAGQVIPCWNDVIWANVGPPRGGPYIWAPSITRTYDYGPPKHSGQWLLGLFGAPYFCIVNPHPIVVFPGKFMLMLGSSR